MPPLRDTQQAQMRQQWHRPHEMFRVGMNVGVPKREMCVCEYMTWCHVTAKLPKFMFTTLALICMLHLC